MIGLLLLACTPPEKQAVDPGEPAVELTIPDLGGVDLEVVAAEALSLAMTATTTPAWAGHAEALDLRQEGCPDLYAGPPDEDDAEVDGEGGLSWYDRCETAGGLSWSGFAWWDAWIEITDEVDGQPGTSLAAERTLEADAAVSDGEGLIYGFDGQASDALSVEETKGYSAWTWSSTVLGTLEGRQLFESSATPDGWRADLYLYAYGGDAEYLELTGNLYFFGPVLQDRFDSIALDLSWTPEGSAEPDACTSEPQGWIGVRDTDAFWYDLVFQPTETDELEGSTDDAPYTDCDGCATLYIRGIEQGTLCPDLGFVWEEGVTLPSVEDYVLTLRDLEAP